MFFFTFWNTLTIICMVSLFGAGSADECIMVTAAGTETVEGPGELINASSESVCLDECARETLCMAALYDNECLHWKGTILNGQPDKPGLFKKQCIEDNLMTVIDSNNASDRTRINFTKPDSTPAFPPVLPPETTPGPRAAIPSVDVKHVKLKNASPAALTYTAAPTTRVIVTAIALCAYIISM